MSQKTIHSKAYLLLRQHLVAARHEAGLTQAQLAARLKRPQSFIAKYENGERRLDIIELLQIAAHIDLDVSATISAVRRRL